MSPLKGRSDLPKERSKTTRLAHRDILRCRTNSAAIGAKRTWRSSHHVAGFMGTRPNSATSLTAIVDGRAGQLAENVSEGTLTPVLSSCSLLLAISCFTMAVGTGNPAEFFQF